MRVKRILKSVVTISAVSAMVVGTTLALFRDVETSSGNVLSAGDIDLKLDNESYIYENGQLVRSDGTTWGTTNPVDLDDGQLFFNFTDRKPGDWGEDTISLHVGGNDAWACASIELTENDENVANEPEQKEGDDTDDTADAFDGELAQNIDFIWWADDGDNVLEQGEQVLTGLPEQAGPVTLAELMNQSRDNDNFSEFRDLTLADSFWNMWSNTGNNPIAGGETHWIGKGWCFGTMTVAPVAAGDGGPIQRGAGFSCDGEDVSNLPQTDRLMGTLQFSAVQARNNMDYLCPENEGTVTSTPTPIPTETPIPTATPVPGQVLDSVNMGDNTAVSNHQGAGWLDFADIGDYAGGNGGAYDFQMVWGDGGVCDGNNNMATVVMDAGSGTANSMTIHHLDGQSEDSLEVFVDNVSVGIYTDADPIDDGESSNNWKDTTFALDGQSFTGTATVKIVVTGAAGSLCAAGSNSSGFYYGQVAVSDIAIET